MKIRLTFRASQQLLSAYEYLQDVADSAASTQMKLIFDSIDLLEKFPLAGRQGKVAGTREMVVPRTPFIVVYAIEADEVQILSILHASRRWPKSF